jgi:hypothetical protein
MQKDEIGNEIHSKLGIDGDVVEKLRGLRALNGTKDIEFDISVKQGKGSGSSEQTTWWKTLTGYGEILAPDEGSWHIVAKIDGKTFIDKTGVQKGQKINFTTGTGFKSKFEIDAEWSEIKDTDLKLKLHVTY